MSNPNERTLELRDDSQSIQKRLALGQRLREAHDEEMRARIAAGEAADRVAVARALGQIDQEALAASLPTDPYLAAIEKERRSQNDREVLHAHEHGLPAAMFVRY
jgi:hypothetical protein